MANYIVDLAIIIYLKFGKYCLNTLAKIESFLNRHTSVIQASSLLKFQSTLYKEFDYAFITLSTRFLYVPMFQFTLNTCFTYALFSTEFLFLNKMR